MESSPGYSSSIPINDGNNLSNVLINIQNQLATVRHTLEAETSSENMKNSLRQVVIAAENELNTSLKSMLNTRTNQDINTITPFPSHHPHSSSPSLFPSSSSPSVPLPTASVLRAKTYSSTSKSPQNQNFNHLSIFPKKVPIHTHPSSISSTKPKPKKEKIVKPQPNKSSHIYRPLHISAPTRHIKTDFNLNPQTIDKGLCFLLQSGIIPSDVDLSDCLTGPTGVLSSQPVTLNPPVKNKTPKYHLQPIDPSQNTLVCDLPQIKSIPIPPKPSSAPSKERKEKKERKEMKEKEKPSDPLLNEFLCVSNQPSNHEHVDQKEIEKARNFFELLDDFSQHQFMIRKGHAITNTPEFQSYKRKYSFLFGEIAKVIQMLEKLLIKYNIPLVYINGIKVVNLAENVLSHPTITQLLDCIVNIDEVKDKISLPNSKFQGPKGLENAAVQIQSIYRMHKDRKNYLFHRKSLSSIVVIQRMYRNWRRYKKTRETIYNTWQIKLKEWKNNVQLPFLSSYNNFLSRHRVHIHIPSINLEEDIRKSQFMLPVLQNQQIGRIFEVVHNPLIDVIFLTAQPLSKNIIIFYFQLLQVCGVKDPSSRIKFLSPEITSSFPPHASLSSLLYYSPYCLKKIKDYLFGRPCCIIPYIAGLSDFQIAVQLNIPILSSFGDNDQKSSLMMTKSHCRTLFRQAELNIPIGIEMEKVENENKFYENFCNLILDHLDVKRWIFKINHGYWSKGLAYYDIMHLKIHGDLVKESHSPYFHTPEMQATCRDKLINNLKLSVPIKTIIVDELCEDIEMVNQSSIAIFHHFLSTMIKYGGIIESVPAKVFSSPSVNLFIDPTGEFKILNTYEQIFSRPFKSIGALFPQTTLPLPAINSLLSQLTPILYQEGIWGYINIDLVFFEENNQKKICPIDLNLHYPASQAIYQLFDSLMNGTLSPSGHYHISTVNSSLSHSPNRCFSFIHYLYQPTFSSIDLDKFFTITRQKGIRFKKDKIGLTTLPFDSLANGMIGILSVHSQSDQCLSLLSQGVGILQNLFGQLNLEKSEHVYRQYSNLYEISSALSTLCRCMKIHS